MRRTTLVIAMFMGLMVDAIYPGNVSACRRGSARCGRLIRRPCCNTGCPQRTVEPAQAEAEAPAAPKPSYASELKTLTEKSFWCKVYYNSDHFLVKTEKLRKPLSDLVRQAEKDWPENRDRKRSTFPFGGDLGVRFLDQDGNTTGCIEFWAFDMFGKGRVLGMARFEAGELPLHPDAIERFRDHIKPILYDFENNCEALASGNQSLVHSALYGIAQKAFRDQARKAVERIEPFLRSKDRDTQEVASRLLLELVPEHKEAKRVLAEVSPPKPKILAGSPVEAAVVTAIEKLGGKAEVDPKLPGKPVVAVILDRTNATDADLKQLKELKSLQFLSLDDAKITDEGLKPLRELTSLETLKLSDTKITNEGLKELKDLKGLQWLCLPGTNITEIKELKALTNLRMLMLSNTRVTDGGLKGVEELTKLQKLYLSDTKITDAGLKGLKELTSLEELDLGGTRITDAGLKDVNELKTLWRLNLNNTAITDAGLKELKDLKNLISLYLKGTKITDAGLKELKGFENLSTLDLWGTEITDAGLRELKALKHLRTLAIGDTRVTAEGVKDLRTAVPNVGILHFTLR